MKQLTLRRRQLMQWIGFGATAQLVKAQTGADAESRPCTARQTAGPFYPVIKPEDTDLDLRRIAGRRAPARGQHIMIDGQVVTRAGSPVGGALVEIWQANHHGRYRHHRDPNPAPIDPNFQGYGRVRCGDDGRFRLHSIIPGAYPAAPGWWRPPHIHYRVEAAGFGTLTTQMYFAGQTLNNKDAILQLLTEAEREVVTVSFSARAQQPKLLVGEFRLVMCG